MSALHNEVRSRLDSGAMLTYKIGINLKSQFGLLFRVLQSCIVLDR